ncbi:hypothetical protein N8502_03235 [Gammaproteobacteria bacterium]|nr:hypothetical protein [Gammaproteobacteria bacterium]
MIDEQQIKALFLNDANINLVAAYGSYARGEAAYILGDNDINLLYNDFDMVVAVKDRGLFNDNLEHYEDLMTQIVGGAQVDILVLDKPISNRQKSSIWYVDFQAYSKIFIGGEREMEYYFGMFTSYPISIFDVYGLFITRSWAAGSLNPLLNHSPFTKIYKGYQAAKLVIATVDLYLLAHSRYTTKLNDKLHALMLIDDDFSKYLAPKFAHAVEVKLSPLIPFFLPLSNISKTTEELICDYNDAFSAYISSKTYASDTMLKIFMILRYLKAIIFAKDALVAKKLRMRHEIAYLIRSNKRKSKILNYDDRLARCFKESEL